jgi:hypothetical protein
LAIHGSSGVGKTRTVFEALKEQPEVKSMVIYSSNEDGFGEVANLLVNYQPAFAIFVADECSVASRVRLSSILRGFRDKVRCICIDNSAERFGSVAPELLVPKPTIPQLQTILKDNFPQIAPERIRAYAQLSEGFVRIAADMCAHYDETIKQAGDMSPIARKLEEYFVARLETEDRRKAVEAIALLKRVKRKGDTPTELDSLCRLLGEDRQTIEQNLAAIKDAPGFVERGALYYRVTPELIASIAFEAAWHRWVENDPDSFLSNLPETIHEPFLERVSEGRNEEVRKIVRDFFRRFADAFTARDLQNIDLVNKLIKLVETDPDTYLPHLRRILETATPDQLGAAVEPDWIGSVRPRRHLVWLAEQFVQFKEFFRECETILFILGVNESEPTISNNSSRIWQQLFRMYLSGSDIPFPARLDILRQRLSTATTENAELLAGAIGGMLEFQAGRILGPPVVAGRIVPAEWSPEPERMVTYVMQAFEFVVAASNHPVPEIASRSRDILLRDIAFFARQGWVDQLRGLLATSPLNEDDRARLVSQLKTYVALAGKPADGKVNEEYKKKLIEWILELEPHSLHSRLIEIVGVRSWDHYGRESEWEAELLKLAGELRASEQLLEKELVWLTSSEALSSFELGFAFGKNESDTERLDKILAASIDRDLGFVRGFIAGLLAIPGFNPGPINQMLDQFEKAKPELTFQLALAGGAKLYVFDRTVRLVSNGKLPHRFLRAFTYWVGSSRVAVDQITTALRLLLPCINAGDESCSAAAMEYLSAALNADNQPEILRTEPELFWNTLEAFTVHPGRQETWWWARIMESILETDPDSCIRLACLALVSDRYALRDDASNLLSAWSTRYPRKIMSAVGQIMLDEKRGVQFFFSKFQFFSTLPLEVVTDWLSEVGEKGAEKIARHLPQPRIDADGNPSVPELTAWVLTRFEKSQRVFSEFCAGVHSFQMYHGDAALVHDAEAMAALKFYDHPIPRIREWARYEFQTAQRNAEFHREADDMYNG